MAFLFLALLAAYLMWILFPFGMIFMLITAIRLQSATHVWKWAYDVAYQIDVLGNVMYPEFFDFLFLTKKSKYRFGERAETISYILGANKYGGGELNKLGHWFCWFLDAIDPNKSYGGHTRRAVIYEYRRVREQVRTIPNLENE